ncbi:MAG: T9SS type A sorting domain-containing protein [Bacteroidales bacterium]|nr:T9SS type A sorting domain-containing protein [Bacteroidales bacterium]
MEQPVFLTQGFQQNEYLNDSAAHSIYELPGLNNKIAVYPNPAKELVILFVENIINKNLIYSLHDNRGLLIQKDQIRNVETKISVRHLAPSTYIIDVFDNLNKIKSIKIIKQY